MHLLLLLRAMQQALSEAIYPTISSYRIPTRSSSHQTLKLLQYQPGSPRQLLVSHPQRSRHPPLCPHQLRHPKSLLKIVHSRSKHQQTVQPSSSCWICKWPGTSSYSSRRCSSSSRSSLPLHPKTLPLLVQWARHPCSCHSSPASSTTQSSCSTSSSCSSKTSRTW